jgi:hypothetical protein
MKSLTVWFIEFLCERFVRRNRRVFDELEENRDKP